VTINGDADAAKYRLMLS